MKFKSLFLTILTMTNVMFVIYYMILAVFNCPSQDDWLFLRAIENNDMYSFLEHVYLHQSGRMTGYFIHYITFSLFSVDSLAWGIPLLSYVFSAITSVLCVKRIRKKLGFREINLALIFLNILIICNFEFCAFYWCCASMSIFSAMLFLYLFVLLLTFKGTFGDIAQLLIVLPLKAFSSEFYTPLFAGFMLIVLFYKWKNTDNKELFYGAPSTKWTFLSIIVLFIGFLFIVTAPGNYERAAESMYVKASSVSSFLHTFANNILLYFYLFAFKIHYWISLFFIMLFFGASQWRFPINCSCKSLIIYSALLYVILIALAVMPMAYLMSSFGFQRFYLPCIMVGLVLITLLGWKVGSDYAEKNNYISNTLVFVSLLLILSCLCLHIYIDTPTVKKYAADHKNRTNTILKAKENGNADTLYLSPLSDVNTIGLKWLILRSNKSVLYYKDEITDNPLDYANQCIASYYNIEFPIAIKK